jgi:hypothetical protein
MIKTAKQKLYQFFHSFTESTTIVFFALCSSFGIEIALEIVLTNQNQTKTTKFVLTNQNQTKTTEFVLTNQNQTKTTEIVLTNQNQTKTAEIVFF